MGLFRKRDGVILLNFASGIFNVNFGVDIIPSFIEYLGGTSLAVSRNKQLGWCFFDYAFDNYGFDASYAYINVVDVIIDSNFEYTTYPKVFGRYIPPHSDL